jgi:glycine cleavage system T protein
LTRPGIGLSYCFFISSLNVKEKAVQGSSAKGAFVFEAPDVEPAGSVLYDEHLKLTSKSRMSPFAGYLMPLWYSSIAEEHQAVRRQAGLFDCTHMGVLEARGEGAMEFLNAATTNDVSRLAIGRAQYSYVIDAAGNVLDDIIVYRRGDDNFMVVVNASNEPKIKRYLGELLAGRIVIETKPRKKMGLVPAKPCVLRDMRDTTSGSDCRVDLALQGPASVAVLAKLADDKQLESRLAELKGFAFVESCLGGVDCIISKTGYTGAKVGFELFVHPNNASRLWNLILGVGLPIGAIPCGLGARDSLRVEAGLPLYGHELDGKFNISPFEAGYGWAVKLDKPFFIGKTMMTKIAETYEMQVARVELPATKGIRPVRGEDAILNAEGACIGWVLSCAKAEDQQYALVYADRNSTAEGSQVGVYYLARSAGQVQEGRKERVDKGQKATADLTGVVVSRFARF